MVRVVQYWTKNPETGERIDISYELQALVGEDWVPVPVVEVEVRVDQENHD